MGRGLDPDKNTIIEIATLITNPDLQVIAQGPVLAIHQSEEILIGMDEWNTRQHNQSGLVERVRNSQITLAMAEESTLNFLRQQIPPNTSPMCGNTVSQDRRFLYRYMPNLESYFHYRHIDVSTLKELAKRWLPNLPEFEKESKHLAMNDIYDSLEELKYYRQHFFRLTV